MGTLSRWAAIRRTRRSRPGAAMNERKRKKRKRKKRKRKTRRTRSQKRKIRDGLALVPKGETLDETLDETRAALARGAARDQEDETTDDDAPGHGIGENAHARVQDDEPVPLNLEKGRA